jgi:hypothetical protein
MEYESHRTVMTKGPGKEGPPSRKNRGFQIPDTVEPLALED